LPWKRPKRLVEKFGDAFRTHVNPYGIACLDSVMTKWKMPMFFVGLSFVVFLPTFFDSDGSF
jgi:hypothetical protein